MHSYGVHIDLARVCIHRALLREFFKGQAPTKDILKLHFSNTFKYNRMNAVEIRIFMRPPSEAPILHKFVYLPLSSSWCS